jgi:recombination protein RecA
MSDNGKGEEKANYMNPAAALRTTTLGFRPETRPREYLETGTALDALTQGFPRGAISEITGPDSSGRTAVAHAVLAAATTKLEICAYVDTNDSLDPCSGAAAGIALDRLIWVRCGGNTEHAMKAADNLLHAGGFGVVVLDLCHVSERVARRIPLSYWYRFRLAIENTPSILLLVEREPLAKSCAALMLDMKRNRAMWTGAPGFRLLRGIEVQASRRKPVAQASACALKLAV